MRPFIARLIALPLLLAIPGGAQGEWTHRYPKIANVNHHVYLEGFNLPTLAASPTDPAPSPDGRTVAFAARGWLWTMDVATREAKRLTRGGGVDARPAWSRDGRSIVFVRDDSSDTAILLVDVATGRERVLVDSPKLDLDPVFAPDGASVFYSSAEAGDLDLWRVDVASAKRTRMTTARGQELNPQPMSGNALAYVAKVSGSNDTVAMLSLNDGASRQLRAEGLAPQLRVSASPDGASYAMTSSDGDRTRLSVVDARTNGTIHLAAGGYPLSPAWGRDGSIWFVEPGDDEQFRLRRIAATGGVAEDLSPTTWDLGERTAQVTIRTRQGDRPTATRLSVIDSRGHPLIPAKVIARFDGAHGRIFFYSPGTITLDVPAGGVRVIASHGFDGVAESVRTVRAGDAVTIDLDLPSTGFDGPARGWYSADLHSHLNYGGPFQLSPDDLVADMRAEGLDVATPMLANLHTNLIDTRWWGWRRTTPPLIGFAQEVRSHFLGHVGVIGADALHTPWFFGPGYPVYGQLDLSNQSPLAFARAHGGMNVYVHPVEARDPFAVGSDPDLPHELVTDAVLGDVDAIELACLWSDELGTAEAWYRLLTIGVPIVPSGGSDTMHNFHRTMAIGAARVFAKPDGPLGMTSFLDAVREGRSFVSTGPMIEFVVAGVAPGGVLPASGELTWTLDAWSPTAVETVEIIVNGRVAWRGDGLSAAGKRRYEGKITVPAGGWVAARIHGGAARWPVQDSYPFAHTAPVWIGCVGSSDPVAARAAAGDLLRAVDGSARAVETAYPGGAAPALKARFAEARRRLQAIASDGAGVAAQ